MQLETARNLREGLSSLGDRPLKTAQFGLEKAKSMYDMRRQQELDELMRPIHEEKAMIAKQNIAQLDTPVTLAAFAKDQHSLLHLVWDKSVDDETMEMAVGRQRSPRTEPVLGEKIAGVLGGQWDIDDASETYGNIVRPDGSVVTMGDVKSMAPQIQALITANTGLDHTIKTQKKRLESDYAKGLFDKEVYRTRKKKIDDFDKDNRAKANVLKDQLAKIQSLTSTTNPVLASSLSENIPRIEKKIAKLEDQAFESEQRQADRTVTKEEGQLNRKLREAIAKLGREPKQGDSVDAYDKGKYYTWAFLPTDKKPDGEWREFSISAAELRKIKSTSTKDPQAAMALAIYKDIHGRVSKKDEGLATILATVIAEGRGVSLPEREKLENILSDEDKILLDGATKIIAAKMDLTLPEKVTEEAEVDLKPWKEIADELGIEY
jgi:hypothetical protein